VNSISKRFHQRLVTHRRLDAPGRSGADRLGLHRVGRLEDRQAGPEPEVDSWRDIISSEAVLGRLEALKRPGREGRTFRCLAMRYRPSQAVRRFDRLGGHRGHATCRFAASCPLAVEAP